MNARRRQSKGSILVVVMITLLFAVTALVAFLDRASTDLLVAARVTIANRLRMDAYSGLEVTLAVLEDFRQADSGLHSQGEGWGNPLAWAGWAPADGNQVDVSFVDESGKIPLVHADSAVLVNLFEAWNMAQPDAQQLADALMSWMQKNYTPQVGLPPDYEQAAIPFDAPLRPLRSYSELQSIDYAKDVFFDKDGGPTALYWRFCDDCSLFSYPTPNINGANADVLAAEGQFTADQAQSINDYMNGKGDYASTNPMGTQWFTSASQVSGVVGANGTPNSFSTTISALRILITVHDRGGSQFRLSVVVAPQGGASTIQTTATDIKNGTSNSTNGGTTANNGLNNGPAGSNNTVATSAQTASASSQNANLKYPDTILEILENDQIPVEPPPPPPSS